MLSPAFLLVKHELRGLPVRPRFYLKRTGLVMFAALVLLWGALSGSAMQTSAMGLRLFRSLATTMLFALAAISALSAAGLVMREKDERTVGILLLSDVTSGRFLVGKLLAGLLVTLFWILSLLPLLMLAVSLGGVSTTHILAAFAVLLGAVFLCACIGTFAAALSRTENASRHVLVLCGAVVLLGLPGSLLIPHLRAGTTPSLFQFCLVSPFVAMYALVHGRPLLPCLLNPGVCVFLGLPFLLAARFVLPRRVLGRHRPPLSLSLKERLRSFRRLRRWVVPPRVSGNPVTFSEFYLRHGGHRATWLKFALSVSILPCLILFIAYRIPEFGTREAWHTVFFTVFLVSAGVVALGGVSHCAAAFTREKRDGAMEPLLLTSLTDGEVVRGKLKAVLLSLLPWILCAAVCAVVALARFRDEDGFWTVSVTLCVEFLAMLFGYGALALLLSLRFKKNIGFGVCFLVFMLWNSLVRGFLVAATVFLSSHWPMVATDVAVHVGLGAVCTLRLATAFRRLALRHAQQ